MSYSRNSFHSIRLWWVLLLVVGIALSFKLPIGQKISLAMAPLLQAVQAPLSWYAQLSLWFERSGELQVDYHNLQTRFAKQQSLSQEIASLRTENKQLRQLLNMTQMEGYFWRASRVISRGPEKKSRRLMVQADFTHLDDVVVSHDGLVGLVDSADQQHAVVRTILDASLAVPVTMQDSDLAGLVRGDGDHLLVDFVPLDRAPEVGDILLTSGAGGLFPAGLPVAVVEQVRAVDGGVFAHVQASPVAYWQRDAWLAIVSAQVPPL
ncbi:MAG: rod shape-determining protein MreC [Ghiorsea sp.]